MEAKLTNLEKTLLAMSHLGIRIENAHGHRWIYSEPTECYDFAEALKRHGVSVNNKIDGGYMEAIAVVQDAWFEMYNRHLDSAIDWMDEDDIFEIGDYSSRIGIVKPGEGGLH